MKRGISEKKIYLKTNRDKKKNEKVEDGIMDRITGCKNYF